MKSTFEPLAQQVLTLLRKQGPRGLSAMDAMRANGMAGSSFTKRISDLRRAGVSINRVQHTDPLTGRKFGRYILATSAKKQAA